MKEVKLPSGNILKIHVADFHVSRELYKAVLKEGKALKLNPKDNVDVNFFKDLFCSMLSSDEIEKRLWDCMKKSLINNLPITEQTFEPVEMRGDYLQVMIEVARENVMPFMKDLYAQYAPLFKEILGQVQA